MIGICLASTMGGDIISSYVMRLFSIQLMILYLPSFMVGTLVRKFISHSRPKFIYVVFVGVLYLSLLQLRFSLLRGVTLISGCLFIFLIFQNLEALLKNLLDWLLSYHGLEEIHCKYIFYTIGLLPCYVILQSRIIMNFIKSILF